MKKDKILHLIAGIVLGSLGSFYNLGFGIILATLGGLIKEYYDSLGYGIVDRYDLYSNRWYNRSSDYLFNPLKEQNANRYNKRKFKMV
jgi:hypothetical protein